jgi:DNA-binding transcriptional MerR regulator
VEPELAYRLARVPSHRSSTQTVRRPASIPVLERWLPSHDSALAAREVEGDQHDHQHRHPWPHGRSSDESLLATTHHSLVTAAPARDTAARPLRHDPAPRTATLDEVAHYLRTVTNRDGGPPPAPATVDTYVYAGRALDAWMSDANIKDDFTVVDTNAQPFLPRLFPPAWAGRNQRSATQSARSNKLSTSLTLTQCQSVVLGVMFTIEDFARYGQVPIRMLRQCDAIGLLRPARGYRYYEAGQFRRLNRIIALQDLGFTLEQVGAMLDERVSLGQLRGMLRLRKAELQNQIVADTAQVARVEARLQLIEMEGAMLADAVQVKRIPAVRVAELTAIVASLEPTSTGPVVQPLCGELGELLSLAGMVPIGPAIASYEDVPDGDGVLAHVSVPVNSDVVSGHGFRIVDLPEIGQAATIVHRGPIDNVMATSQPLARWIDDNGYHSAGNGRELYLECPDDQDEWVIELQEPITPG